MLNEKAGCDVTTPAGASRLNLDIQSVTGEKLALNTIKRLTGVIPNDFSAREATLDIFARYLGFSSWERLLWTVNNKTSDFDRESPLIDATDLPKDVEIELCWEPNREIIIRHLGEGRFQITKAKNSKLIAGDILILSQFAEGFPFFVREVIRDGENLGCYTAAPTMGLSKLTILPTAKK